MPLPLQGEWQHRYEGGFRDGKAHGQWTLFFRGKRLYEGEWRGGQLHTSFDKGTDELSWLILEGWEWKMPRHSSVTPLILDVELELPEAITCDPNLTRGGTRRKLDFVQNVLVMGGGA